MQGRVHGRVHGVCPVRLGVANLGPVHRKLYAMISFTQHFVRIHDPSIAIPPRLWLQHAGCLATSLWQRRAQMMRGLSVFGRPAYFDAARRNPAHLRVGPGQTYDPDSFWMITEQRA